MIDEHFQLILEEAREGMQKSLEHLAHELGHIRAGRANPAMVEDVRVDAYGSQMPLNQVATVNAPQSDLIVIQPWDKSMLGAIERGIMQANLGLNPTNDGVLIRIAVPPLTEERRRDLTKQARAKAEEAKIAVRNVRRGAKDQIGKTFKAESLSEDMRYEAEDRLQKATDQYTGKIDAMVDKKETDIMTV
ncbi:MAG: ribosome recycling factor [Bacteroidota bacterium]